MTAYVIKTGYGQEGGKKIRIFKLNKTSTISSPPVPNGGFKNTDPQGQSVIGFTRSYPLFTCEGALPQAGPINIGFDDPGSVIAVDFPEVPSLPLVECSTVEQVKAALAVRDVRMLETEIWSDESTV